MCPAFCVLFPLTLAHPSALRSRNPSDLIRPRFAGSFCFLHVARRPRRIERPLLLVPSSTALTCSLFSPLKDSGPFVPLLRKQNDQFGVGIPELTIGIPHCKRFTRIFPIYHLRSVNIFLFIYLSCLWYFHLYWLLILAMWHLRNVNI